MMKRIISLIFAMLISMSLLSCGTNPDDGPSDTSDITDTDAVTETESTDTEALPEKTAVDLMEKALDLCGIEKRLVKMSSKVYGASYFQDYTALHSNPLNTASYPMELSALTKEIKASSEGLDDFCYNVTENYGHKTKMELSYTEESNVDSALEKLFALSGSTDGLEEAKKAAEGLDTKFSAELTKYLSAINCALERNLAELENISDEDYAKIAQFSYCDVSTSDPSSLNFIRSKYKASSLTRLLRSGFLLVRATSEFTVAVSKLDSFTKDAKALSFTTPFGDIMIGSKNADRYISPDALLIVEPAGNELYMGKIAASGSKSKPISLVIDLSGNDKYVSGNTDGATQGSGIFGTGILFDLVGDDIYSAYRLGQGASLIGTGVLFDGAGNDKYTSKLTSQGASYFGFATLADACGNDSYDSMAASQAAAGTRAMAFLVDSEGNDNYYVEPYEVAGFEFLDYGQFKDVNGNWSQGCAMGQRNIDIAGGIAGLIDASGDDVYTGGIWVQGVGYWGGIGFLSDMDGNDVHNSQYYSQASVAHFGIGILINVGGDDVHSLKEGKTDGGEGASIGFVWDRGVAMFVNDGGNDSYTSTQTCCGSAWSAYDDRGPKLQDMTYAFFIETEGNDRYSASKDPSYGYGLGGFFIDAAGNDKYYGTIGIKQGMEQRNEADYGVVIDFMADENEKAVIGIWEEAKAKYFD